MNEDLKRWDEEAEIWTKNSETKRILAKTLVADALTQLKDDLSGKKVLDTGCGEGSYTKMIQNHGAEVTGLDGSPKMLEFAKKRLPGVNFILADLLADLPIQDISFDTVVSINVLMSLESIEVFLQQANRILKPNGVLIVGVFHPALNHPTTRLYNTWWRRLRGKPVIGVSYSYFLHTDKRKDDFGEKPWPFYHRTIEEYSKSFGDNGFVIQKILEPHEVPTEVLAKNPKLKYATRLPRFIFFRLIKS